MKFTYEKKKVNRDIKKKKNLRTDPKNYKYNRKINVQNGMILIQESYDTGVEC